MTPVLIDLALALAVLVVVPLALRLDRRRPLDRRLGLLVRGAAGAATASMLLDEGVLAAVVATPWLVIVLLLAARQAFPLDVRTLLHGSLELLPAAYLATGAGWLVISRYGGRPLDFDATIVELTAVHFHYAGFVAPSLVRGLVARLRADGVSDTGAQASLAAVLAGTPLTAAGIAVEPALGVAGAVLFAAGLTASSVLTLRWVVPRAGRARLPLAISSCSAIASMGLAVAYASGQWLGTPAPSVPVMVATHGVLNAAGYALGGVVGWLWENGRGVPAGTPLPPSERS